MSDFLSADYWNTRYLHADFGWDLGAISPPLQHYFDQLINPNLKILIPGAGNAYEAEYLINKGFRHVYVCDLAPEPLKNLKERCPAIREEQLLLGDFFELQESKFDLIVEQTFFCAIDPLKRRAYFEKMHALLNSGGKLVGLLFNDVLNSNRPPFGGNKHEYEKYFEDTFTVRTYAACHNSIKPRAGRELFINLVKK